MPTATKVQTNGLPGSQSQPATNNATREGSSRLRSRLSAIFHRAINPKRFFTFSFWEFGTRGKSHGSNCQSPRTHR